MPLRFALVAVVHFVLAALGAGSALAAQPGHKSEIDLVMPDLSQVTFLGIDGHTLLLLGIGVCIAGLAFGLVFYGQLKNMPVHRSMREISELIYETCKTYLLTQGRFILILWLFIAAIMVVYFGFLIGLAAYKVGTIGLFGLSGIAGS
jgi:K(+)-stimulated pyrophosphate-energized sodium pump